MKNTCVFLLVGDEEFLKEEWLWAAREKFFRGENSRDSADFNIFFANEKDFNLPDVLYLARTRPFTQTKRFIILRNIEAINLPSDKELLLAYVKSPSQNAVLILEADVKEKEFIKDNFLSGLAKFTQTVSFKKLYDANLYNWVLRRSLMRRKKLEPAAFELLKQLKGNNLRVLDEEIEKLSIYVAERPTITKEDVERLVGRDITGSIYDIIDALTRKDKGRVLRLSADVQKKDLGNSVGLLCWNLRLLLKTRLYLKQGWPTQRIGEAIGLDKFRLEKIVFQAKRLSSSWIEKAISEVADFDLKIKTTGIYNSFSGWQMLLVRLLAFL